MFAYEPTCEDEGVPLKRPVVVLNDAHVGLFEMLNRSGSPFASRAVGWKLYAMPTVAEVEGVPEIVGATLLRDTARIEKAGNDRVLTPSLTRIWMLPQSPTAEGVPESRPLDVLKVAHQGLFVMLKVSLARSGSEAVGVNEYCEPTYTDAAGVPEMLGARFCAAATLLTSEPAMQSTRQMSAATRAASAEPDDVDMSDPHGLAVLEASGTQRR
jgi:hypothetical protein